MFYETIQMSIIEENGLYWTKKVALSKRLIDPLGVGLFRMQESYFFKGITTQTEHLKYYTFLAWAFHKRSNLVDSPKNLILNLEKIFTLISANHHKNSSISGLTNIESAKKFLQENENYNLEKIMDFGGHNTEGYGSKNYKGSLVELEICWNEDGEFFISTAGKEISEIFSESIRNIENKLTSKSFSKNDLEEFNQICLCTNKSSEQQFWKKIFFGLTKKSRNDIEIDNSKKIVIKNPYELTFERFKISEVDTINADIDNLFSEFQKNKVEDESIEMMRTGTLFLILKIIKSSKIEIKGELGKQAIRDAIYYSQIIHQEKVNKIDFEVLEPFRKFWEVYVHNLYYISIFDRILSIIIHITKRNPLGIDIDGISNKISLEIVIKTINDLGINVHPSESILDVYSKLSKKLNRKNTTLESSINENRILKKLVRSKDISKSIAGILIIFLLCKYRYSSFDKKQLETLSYKQDPVVNIHPSKMYADIEQNTISEFIEWIFSYVIKRHSYISMKKMQAGTNAWLFTKEANEIFYYPRKEYKFTAYPEARWRNVIEIISDLGLISKISEKNNEFWKLTVEGEEWLKQIQ